MCAARARACASPRARPPPPHPRSALIALARARYADVESLDGLSDDAAKLASVLRKHVLPAPFAALFRDAVEAQLAFGLFHAAHTLQHSLMGRARQADARKRTARLRVRHEQQSLIRRGRPRPPRAPLTRAARSKFNLIMHPPVVAPVEEVRALACRATRGGGRSRAPCCRR